MRGLLIVCEGLDCSGKTTSIEKIVDSNSRFVYSKGIGSNSNIGRTARRFPSTFIFLSELVYNSYTHIIPNLRKNKIVLQDRYDISISSFIPNSNRRYNKLLINMTRLLIPKPDGIVYFYLPIEERIKRLIQKGKKYELILAENPEMIVLREREYEKWYEQFNGEKIRIDTYENSIEETSKLLKRFISGIENTLR